MATALDPDPSERIKELLTCCICGKTLDEPKTLPCFHSFCKKCLTKSIEPERRIQIEECRNPHRLNCPTCRTQFELKQGYGVEQILPNHFINSMLEILPVIQQQAQKLQCDSCKVGVSSKSRCIDCERYLCADCLAAHNKWPGFRQHVVMTLEELSRPENQSKARGRPRCQKQGHGNKPFEFYCNTCLELVCINCVVLDHPKPNHSYEPTDKVAEQHKKVLNTTAETLQKMSRETEITSQKIDQAIQHLQVSTIKTKDLILQQQEEILRELAKKVEHNTKILLGEVDRKHDTINQELVKQHDDMKAYREKVNGSLGFAKNMIEKASSEEIALLGSEIQVNANNIKKECPKMMEPIHDGVIEYQAKLPKTIVDDVNMTNLGCLVYSPFINVTREDLVSRALKHTKEKVSRITKQTTKHVNPVAQSLCNDSIILEGDIEYATQLVQWVRNKKFSWQLCYRASRDGWGSEDFHRKCDDVGSTVTLVKCRTNIFGGFTDQSWKITSGIREEFKSFNLSFLFSLRNLENMQAFKCPIKNERKMQAICCNYLYGPAFGHDLVIGSYANTSKISSSNLGATYQPPPAYQPGAEQTRALLTGSYNFTQTEIEIFVVEKKKEKKNKIKIPKFKFHGTRPDDLSDWDWEDDG